MAVPTEEQVRRLAGLRGEGSPITTCYLDVDGRRHLRQQDYERELDGLLRRARTTVNGSDAVHRDLERIEAFVKQGIDRSEVRGLMIVACGADDVWEVIELPVPVRSQIVVNPAPAVSQLESLIQEGERLGVLLVDKQRARVFVFELGVLEEHEELVDELPRDYDDRGERERGGIDHHVEALAHQHVRRAAAAAFEVFKREAFHHLVIGGPDELLGEVESALHPYLRARLAGRVEVPPTAALSDIREAALETERRLERAREAGLVEDLREAVAADRGGVAGLDDVLAALADRRVERLLVSAGYTEGGWMCEKCERLAPVGRTCDRCGAEMVEVEDVVEEAVEDALSQGCRVEMCVDNADLDVLGRIGAVLRY